MSIRQFFISRDVQVSWQRYAIDAFNAMAWGLFASLIVGLILKSLGSGLGISWLVEAGQQAQNVMGAAIGASVAYALRAPVLILASSVAVGMCGALLGGAVGCFIATIVGVECGKLVNKSTPIDVIITPMTTLLCGILAANSVGPLIAMATNYAGSVIMWSVELHPIIMGMLISVLMGIFLTLPISSAAIAITLSLNGLAAGAATVGCCAQMVGFAVMSFPENRWSGLLSQGLGTSMLQMPNIIKNPYIWLPPIITSAILGPVATVVFQMSNIPSAAGMGSSGLVGQIGTLHAMSNQSSVWLAIGLLHFILPALLSWFIAAWMRKKGWIRAGDLTLP